MGLFRVELSMRGNPQHIEGRLEIEPLELLNRQVLLNARLALDAGCPEDGLDRPRLNLAEECPAAPDKRTADGAVVPGLLETRHDGPRFTGHGELKRLNGSLNRREQEETCWL